jgi:aldose sugar dehydrogenase
VISTTAVSRFVLNGNRLTQRKDIFEALPYRRTKHHYGSRLEFDKQGYLYITVGDRGYHYLDPQNLSSHSGKTHRVKEDGTIPPDNPFVNTAGAQASIFNLGHRNQQGMVMHPETGVIWTNEHGPRGGDEINIEQEAKNYGWPVISYGINYNGKIITKISAKKGMEQPQLYWLPSIGPSGMAFVYGNRYKGWEGDLLVGSLRYRYLNRCKVDGDKIVKQEMLFKNIGRVRDVRMGPDGYVYMSVESPGIVFRLTPVLE